MTETTIRQVGNSHGVVVDRATMAAANLHAGDRVLIVPIRDGVVVTAAKSQTALFLGAIQDSLKKHPDIYRELAKR